MNLEVEFKLSNVGLISRLRLICNRLRVKSVMLSKDIESVSLLIAIKIRFGYYCDWPVLTVFG